MPFTKLEPQSICFMVAELRAPPYISLRGNVKMCGIIGAAKACGNAAEEVYEGLKRLEYRGYDSAGITVLDGEIMHTVKKGGRVELLKDGVEKLSGGLAIGHTRWATHGQPTDANAHPHVAGDIAVVHNGIIENFAALKEGLIKEGEEFSSETDSEVIAKLINKFYSGDLLAATARAAKLLKGSFALAAVCRGEKRIVAVKYKSPVIIGFSRCGVYLSSDVPALPPSVSSICIPEDSDVISITAESARFFTLDLLAVNRPRKPVKLTDSGAGKGGYPHYMLKEIEEEPQTVVNTARSFLGAANVKKLRSMLTGADKIIITGCGTAYNAGLVGKRYLARLNSSVTAEIASELRYNLPPATPATVVVAVTQSGETADTVEAASALKERGAKVIAITNCGYSAITRTADAVVPVSAGAEICVAATKSYIGQLAALYLLSHIGGDLLAAKDKLTAVSKCIAEVIRGDYKGVAEACAKSSAVFFLGRGADCCVAVEAALKLKEITYVFSDGYPAGELKHGTLALVDKSTLSVFIITDGALKDKCGNAVEQVLSRGGRAAVITTLPCVAEKFKDKAEVCMLPECEGELTPFITAACLQLIAYRTAVILGRDPDKPRNLAKSVTVE